MVAAGRIREILLHGASDEAFDESVVFARRLAELYQARLHVVYTIEEPLSAGWTAEVSADRLPEVHQAMESEARARLSRLVPLEDQDRLGIEIVLRVGAAATELVRYTTENQIDLAIVQAAPSKGAGAETARALLDHAPCAVLVLR
jgi:nucleotide-binding universal stress UspA family protein